MVKAAIVQQWLGGEVKRQTLVVVKRFKPPTKKVCILYNVLLRWWCRAARSFQNLLIFFSLEGANPKELRNLTESHELASSYDHISTHRIHTNTHTAQHIEKNKNKNKIVEILDSFNFVWSMLCCWSFPLNLHTTRTTTQEERNNKTPRTLSHTFG